jgi:hypothetical protein
LPTAFDVEKMLDYFRDHLPTGEAGDRWIGACELSRVRYRQSTRAVLQYSLEVVDRRTDCVERQIVTGIMYARKDAGQIARKLRRAAPVPRQPTGFPPVGFIPELEMLVQVFPFDRRLPALAPLAHGLPGPLSGVIGGEFDATKWKVIDCQVRPVRYRAGLAAVLRYDVMARSVDDGSTRTKPYFVKVYRTKEEAASANTLLRTLCSLDFGPIRVGRPVAYLNDIHTLVLPAAEGSTLEELLLTGYPEEEIRRVARALAALHQSNWLPARCHTERNQTANLQRAAQRLRAACPELAGQVDATVAQLVDLPSAILAPTHRDLKPEHIFLDQNHVTLIDWDSCAAADPVLDASMLLARLAALPTRYGLPREDVRKLSEIFVNEYFANVPHSWQARLKRHYAGAALEVAVGFYGRQEPRWPETIAALVQEAQAALTSSAPSAPLREILCFLQRRN